MTMRNHIRLIAVLIGLTSMAGILGSTTPFAFAQDVTLSPGIELNTGQVINVIIIGGVAGLLVAYQGYSKSPNDFDSVRFVNGVLNAVLASIPLALATALTTDLNAVGYVNVFFASAGLGGIISKARQTSISSNATDEEIQAILDSRGQ